MFKEFYNKLYSENEITYEDGKPDDIVEDILQFKSSGSALEIGAGEGRNIMFLAENGFQATAQDISQVGIEKINKLSKEKHIDVKTETSDARALNLSCNFDVLVCSSMLHHLAREEALELIKQIKEHTNPGGLNIIKTFTENGDFYRADPNTNNFYVKNDELQKLYEGWEILEYKESEGEAHKQNPDGSQMINISAKILAKKI